MGGKAFSDADHLSTPRMDPDVYESAKERCTSALKTLFPRVEVPIAAPEKLTFGDIDILVSLEGANFPTPDPSNPSNEPVWNLIQEALGGVYSRHQGKGPLIYTKNIAIPWLPTSVKPTQSVDPAASDAHAQDVKIRHRPENAFRYIQVDVHLCKTNHELDWRLFKLAHGDMWSILGWNMRPMGLTADDTSLYIRVPEIEKEHRRASRVFLTSNPTEVLDFLGLSHQNGEWERPFKSVDDMLEYAASCRWFMLWPEGSAGDAEVATPRRTNLRHIFARWMHDFVPRCRQEGRFLVPDPDTRTPEQVRAELRDQAFAAFPESGPAYAATLAGFQRKKVRDVIKRAIKKDEWLPADVTHALPAPRDDGLVAADAATVEVYWRGALRTTLKRLVLDDNERLASVVPPRLHDSEGGLTVEDAKDWVARNWEEVGRAAWSVHCEKASASIKRKRELAEQAAGAAGEGAAGEGAAGEGRVGEGAAGEGAAASDKDGAS